MVSEAAPDLTVIQAPDLALSGRSPIGLRQKGFRTPQKPVFGFWGRAQEGGGQRHPESTHHNPTSCERCAFPVPLSCFYAGGDPSRPQQIDQRPDRPLTRSKRPKCLPHSADLPCLQTRRCHPASISAHPRARRRHQIPIALAASPYPTPRDFVPWRFLDAGSLPLWRARNCRRPKTCTIPDIAAALNGWNRSAQFGFGSQQARQSGMCKTRHPILYLRDGSR